MGVIQAQAHEGTPEKTKTGRLIKEGKVRAGVVSRTAGPGEKLEEVASTDCMNRRLLG